MTHQHNGLHHFARVQAAYAAAVGERQADFSGIERAGETLTPVMDLWSRVEWEHLRAERLFARRVTQAAVAGEFNAIALHNPAASGLLVVVERISVTNGTASTGHELDVATSVALLATLAAAAAPTGLSRDRRNLDGSARAVILVGSDAASFIGSAVERVQTSAANLLTSYTVALPIVLAPGTGLVSIQQTVNQTLVANLAWRERVALPGELE